MNEVAHVNQKSFFPLVFHLRPNLSGMEKNTLVNVWIALLIQKPDFDFEIIIGGMDSTIVTKEIWPSHLLKNNPDKIEDFSNEIQGQDFFIRGRKRGDFNFLENLKAAARKIHLVLCDATNYWIDNQKLESIFHFFK